jgi:hypothetical protein
LKFTKLNTLLILPPSGPTFILVLREGSNILREKFTYKLHDILHIITPWFAAREGRKVKYIFANTTAEGKKV